MAEGYDSAGLLYYLPPELLRNIFIYLPAKTLIRCRRVSPIWKLIIDDMARNDKMWKRNCMKDFPHTYETARNKARLRLSWYNLYRSLSLWASLVQAAEEREEATRSFQEIRNSKIPNHGVIGVLKKGCIVYYDFETLSQPYRPPMMRDYSNYTETDTVIGILGNDSHLFVIRKVERTERDNNRHAITYNNIKQFTLNGKELYFVNRNNDLFVVYLCCRRLHIFYILSSLRTVMTLGHSEGKLNILTVKRKIYSINTNLLQHLPKFQFLENMDRRLYFQCMCIWNQAIPSGPLRDLVSIRQHGDVFIVGSYWGVLRIYSAPLTDEEFDIFNSRPVRQYNLMDSQDAVQLSVCPILNVNVMEEYDGHKVVQITVINFKHDFENVSPRKLKEPKLVEIPEDAEINLCVPGTSKD